jgi:hypothetical protein
MTENFNTTLIMAKRRWPHCTTTGSGSIAVVLGCSYRVLLVQTPIEAQSLANGKCCDHCNHTIAPDGKWHEIVELKEPAAPVSRMRGNFAAFMAAD